MGGGDEGSTWGGGGGGDDGGVLGGGGGGLELNNFSEECPKSSTSWLLLKKFFKLPFVLFC